MTWNLRLTEARQALKLKKSAFAKLVGVSAPTVTDWESGEIVKIDAMNLIKVCEVLQVRPEWMMKGTGPMRPADYSGVDNRIVHALKIMQGMPEYQLDQAVRIIDTLAEPSSANGTTGKSKS